MRLEYLPQADADLEGIITRYGSAAPHLLSGVTDDIERALDRICKFPNAYPRQPGRPYRLHVTRKYRFKIVYLVLDDVVEVIGVFGSRTGKASS